MSNPISKKLLSHTVEYSHLSGVDQFNNPTYDTPVVISYVRVMPTYETILTELGYTKNDDAILIYDKSVSSPANIQFNSNDRVLHDGIKYLVRKTDSPIASGPGAHHDEVRLIIDGDNS